MKVLVTGGAGFIGSWLVDELLAQGAEVVCIDSLDPLVHEGPPDYLDERVDYRFIDLRDWVPDASFEDVEHVFHYAALGGVGRAAREPVNVVDANVRGTARLVEAMSSWPHLRSVVLASSFSIYGSAYEHQCRSCSTTRDGQRDPEALAGGDFEVRCRRCGDVADVIPLGSMATPNPLELYGASKYMQELCFRGFDRAPVHILRQSSVYGPRLRINDGEATIIARLAGWISADIPPELFEDGRQVRDWVDVRDVVAVATRLAQSRLPGGVVNVCSGSPATLLDASDMIAEIVGSKVHPKVVGGFRVGDMRDCLGDASRMREILGRNPIGLTDGLRFAFSSESRTTG